MERSSWRAPRRPPGVVARPREAWLVPGGREARGRSHALPSLGRRRRHLAAGARFVDVVQRDGARLGRVPATCVDAVRRSILQAPARAQPRARAHALMHGAPRQARAGLDHVGRQLDVLRQQPEGARAPGEARKVSVRQEGGEDARHAVAQGVEAAGVAEARAVGVAAGEALQDFCSGGGDDAADGVRSNDQQVLAVGAGDGGRHVGARQAPARRVGGEPP